MIYFFANHCNMSKIGVAVTLSKIGKNRHFPDSDFGTEEVFKIKNRCLEMQRFLTLKNKNSKKNDIGIFSYSIMLVYTIFIICQYFL